MPKTDLWTAQEVEALSGGKSSAPWQAERVCINPAAAAAGDLFIASSQQDIQALGSKAVSAIMAPPHVKPQGQIPHIHVADVFESLQNMAFTARYRTHAYIIAIQSGPVRKAYENMIGQFMDVYAGRRHMSLDLANLPEDKDVGIFGLAPLVRPDIMIITDPGAVQAEAMFEFMSVNAALVINAGSEHARSLIAQAKAMGIRNIHTYGNGPGYDLCLLDSLDLAETIRLNVELFGKAESFFIPRGENAQDAFLPLLLTMPLMGKEISVFNQFVGWRKGSASSAVTAYELHHHRQSNKAAFRIKNIVNFGCGKRTVVLDHLYDKASNVALCSNFLLPSQFLNFNLLCRTRHYALVKDPLPLIQRKSRTQAVEPVSPEVAGPGDYVVFTSGRSGKGVLSQTLRPLPRAVEV